MRRQGASLAQKWVDRLAVSASIHKRVRAIGGRMNDEEAVLAVNAAYYRAFAAGDLEAIEQLWAIDAVSCVHPGWRPLVGREDVIRSYRDILSGAASVPIISSGERALITGDFARVICVERVGAVLLAATNCFVRTSRGWLMAHHQASQIAGVDPPRAQKREPTRRTLN